MRGWVQGEGAFQGKILKQTWWPLPLLAIGSIGPSPTDIFTENPQSSGLSQPWGLQSRGGRRDGGTQVRDGGTSQTRYGNCKSIPLTFT